MSCKEKSFHIKTLGCKVNQYESQVIREHFLQRGYIEAENSDLADVSIVNTCTVTSNSDSKSFRIVNNLVKKNKECIVVTGCMVEDKELPLSRLRGVNFIIKNKDKFIIPDIIDNKPLKSNVTCQALFPGSAISGFKDHTRAFIKIQDGCDNICSYCKVRIVRGRSMSRPIKDVLDECSAVINNGFKEIVLTGICIGSYGKDLSSGGIDLSVLIRDICRIEGDWRLRLSSIEPKDINDSLISQIKSQDKFCKHLHMPFQSGDEDILKRMKRPYKPMDYIRTVNKLKEIMPDIAITTDIMVGFPGETDQHFKNTVNFIKKIRPMRMHIFPFSKRKGTQAYGYGEGIASSVKKERGRYLFSLAKELSNEFSCKFKGKEVKVLIEEARSRDGLLTGYTDRYIKVFLNGPDSLKSKFVKCRVTLTNQKPYGILAAYLE